MSDNTPLTIEVEGVGKVTMVGTGPWHTVTIGHSHEIRDANNQVANPTVVQRFSTTMKPNSNVIFAKPSQAAAVVSAANAEILKDGAIF